VLLRHADGSIGWPEQAPFDGIIVTAAAPEIPPELLAQLADGGRMIIPVGKGEQQQLQLVTRKEAEFQITSIETVRFVPLLGGVVR